MASLYLLGGFSQEASRGDIKCYVEKCLDVKNVLHVWLDPRHQRRAVFQCSQKLDMKKIKDLLETEPLNNKILFGAEEDETEVLYAEVPSMKCQALIDKLPWLFHQRKYGGSKVKSIEKIEENNFKLAFQDGWGAVMRVMKSPWFIGDTEVKVTPYFASFQENYKIQKERLKKFKRKDLKHKDGSKDTTSEIEPKMPSESDENSQIVEQKKQLNFVTYPGTPPKRSVEEAGQIMEQKKPVKTPAEPKHKEIDIDLNPAQCVLLDSLLLTEKTVEKYPNISLGVEKEKISLKGPDSILSKLNSMIKEQCADIEHNWRDEFDLFFNNENHEHLCQYFHNHKITVLLEENTDETRLELFVQQDQQRMSLRRLISTEIHSIQNFIHASSPLEKKAGFHDYLSKFNVKHFEYKLQTQENTWNLFHFGHHFDDKKRKCIVSEIQSFLKDETAPKPGAANTDDKNAAESEKSKPPVTKPKPKIEEVALRKDLVVLLNCLSLGNRIQEHCSVTVEVNEAKGMISLKGYSADVEKIKEMLFSLNENFEKFSNFPVELDKILTFETSKNLFKTHFELRVEPEMKEFVVYIQDKYNKKGRFQDFINKVLNQVKVFSRDASCKTKTESFNSKEYLFKLNDVDNQWVLIKLSYDGHDEQVIREIQDVLPNNNPMRIDEHFDDDDDDYYDAHDTIECKDSMKQPNKQKSISDDRSYSHEFNLQPVAHQFLSNRDMLDSMKRELKAKVSDITIHDSCLRIWNKKSQDHSEAVKAYIAKIKAETITLSYPGVEEFYESRKGRQFFSEFEKKHFCVVSHSYSKKDDEKKYKVAVLGTYQMPQHTPQYTNVFFHVTQGYSKNIHVHGSVYICWGDQGHTDDQQIPVVLPRWSFKDMNNHGEIEFRKRLDKAFYTVVNKGWRNISISVSAEHMTFVPHDILSSAIIEQGNKMFTSCNEDVHIFLCEVKSAPLLKAFQYALSRVTTEFQPPNDFLWRTTISNLVSFNKQPCPEYPNEMKFAVTSSYDDKNIHKQGMVCFPILSPLDVNTCPLKDAIKPMYYEKAISTVEMAHPDGLLVGEQYVINKSPLPNHDVALYGLQPWGIDVKKVLQKTLENCIDAGMKNRVDSLYIIVPGTTPPCLYPREWLVSKWFEHLDNSVKKAKNAKNKFKGTIHFVVEPPEYRELFQKYLKRRVKTGSMSFLTDFFFSTENSKPNFSVISCTSSAHKVEKELKAAMDKLMKDNQRIKKCTRAQHDRLLKICQTNNKIQISSKSVRNKKFKKECQISSLTEEAVNVVLNLLDGTPKSSSVDPDRQATFMSSTENVDKREGFVEIVTVEPNLRRTSSEELNKNTTQMEKENLASNLPQLGASSYEYNENRQLTANQKMLVNKTQQELEHEAPLETPMETDESDEVPESSQKPEACKTMKNLVMNDNHTPKQEGKLVETDDTLRKSCKESNRKSESNVGGGFTQKEIHANTLANVDNSADGSSLPSINNFQWCYHDTERNSVPFDESDENELERSYRKDTFHNVIGMRVNFCTMVATSNDDHLKQFVVSRHELIKSPHVKTPSHWTKDTNVRKTDDESREIDQVLDEFRIIKIERIQNIHLYKNFRSKVKEMAGSSRDKVMWQRIDNAYKHLIPDYGCQKAFLTLKCDELGDGICFTSKPKHCAKETDRKEERPFTLVRCQVCLGTEGKGQPGLRYPPANFSSVSNEDYSMVFNTHQVYPTHFVEVRAE